jgi:RND family efflux transporter MFP subunit
MTLWSAKHELFAEHTAAVVGSRVRFLAHLTVLENFSASKATELTFEITGPETIKASTQKALAPGIFVIEVTANTAGSYKGELRITGEHSDTIEGISFEVYPTAHEAAESVSEGDDTGLIEFLKEQQWGVPFGTEMARMGSLTESVEVAGRVQTPPGGSAEVDAPITGRLVAPKDGLPRPGTTVTKGQVLAELMPAPSSPEAGTRASLAVAESGARASAARAELERAERLIKDEAISQRALENARREVKVAEESVRAARRAADLYAGATGKRGRGGWRLTAPISGTLVSINAVPGATVSPGDTLFEIVDTSELWVVARVPEQEAARLRQDRNASFQIAGLDTWSVIDIMSDDASASIVNVGQIVDPHSRTVDVLYSLTKPDPALRIGGLIQVSLPAGDDFDGIVLPRTALVNQEGRDMVYVQVDGEHFEERLVQVGPRSGAAISIAGGVKVGERVVTKGAHLVRLADRAKSSVGHGHVH